VRRQQGRWFVLLSVAWLRGLAPALAFADSTPTDAAYQEQIRRALQEYELGHWNEAKAFFAHAHALQPSARTLRGLGLASYELRDYVAAIGYVTQALASTERPLTDEMRNEMRGILEQSQHIVSRLHVTLEPKTAVAVVRVDAKPAVVEADGRVLLNPGSHELVAQAPGFESATRTVQSESGDTLELELTLRPAALAPSAAAAGASASASPNESSSAHGSIAPWVVVGASGAVAVTGVVLLALALSDVSSVENARNGSNWATVKSANDSAPTLSAVGIVMIGAGAAGVAAGLAWKFWPRQRERDASATLHLVPGGPRMTGTF
jgi:hypothetical protein